MDVLRTLVALPKYGFSIEGIGRYMFEDLLSNIRHGEISLVLPDGSRQTFGKAKSPSFPVKGGKVEVGRVNPYDRDQMKATITVKNSYVFFRLVTAADVGFAEGFVAGEVDIDDLTNLIKIFIFNRDYLSNLDSRSALVGRLVDRLSHLRLSNTVHKAKENVAAHYDLSNEMFATFLDPSMTYSCAFYEREDETLEQAQMNKIRKMISKAKLQRQHHILEIGSGWGALAIEAVRSSGCRVTTLTLSEEQKVLAEQRIADVDLSDRITVLLCDYRNAPVPTNPVTGAVGYDRIISVEMIEQVGHNFMGTFFNCLDRYLAPEGLVVLQAITMPDFRHAEYIVGCDFIQKHIFPGTCLPSMTSIMNAVAEHTELVLEGFENIGPHYARTLREWRETFNLPETRKKLEKLGFDERFFRSWNYYFCYCEAGFATRTLGDLQLVFSHTTNMSLSEDIQHAA